MKSEKSVIFHFENSFFDTEIHISVFFDFSSHNKIIKLFVVSKNFLQYLYCNVVFPLLSKLTISILFL